MKTYQATVKEIVQNLKNSSKNYDYLSFYVHQATTTLINRFTYKTIFIIKDKKQYRCYDVNGEEKFFDFIEEAVDYALEKIS